jgi:phospholipase B1
MEMSLRFFLFKNGREYREVSFSVGGQTTWREVVTLPNILKIFNPNLYGASE